VHREIIQAGSERPGVRDLQEAEWILVHPVNNSFLVRALEGELDQGEAEAIALALEVGGDLLLVDERRGRRAALRLQVRILGTLGLLIEAKIKGLIPAVQPILDELLHRAGFRLSPDLYARVLQETGES
jgi:predicted nucleic acid-binding protein